MSLANKLQEILRAAAPLLSQVTEAEWNAKPDPERWSKKEILGHLVDSAYNNHQRFVRGAYREDLCFEGYDQNAWVRRNAYQQRPVEDVVGTFFTSQHHLAFTIATLPTDRLDRETSEHNFHRMAMRKVPAGAPRSLGFLIEDYLFHLVHHLQQIVPGLEAEWYAGYQRESEEFRPG